MKSTRHRVWLILGNIAVVLAFLVLLVVDFLLYGPSAKLRRGEIIHEFQAIRPLPNAVLESRLDNIASPWRNHQGSFGASYTTSDDNSQIQQYYDQELLVHGWRKVVDWRVKNWGEDHGDREILYCKQRLYAGLYLRGRKSEAEYPAPGGHEYQFFVAWGSRPSELDHKCD